MKIKLEGKTCTLSVTLTRWKAAFIMLIACLIIVLPIHSCNNANEKLKIALKNKKSISTTSVKLSIVEPIVSPFSLSSNDKHVLNEWLLYRMNHGHDAMLQKYNEVTGGKDEFKAFLYIIETEWRLGHWDLVPKTKH